MSEPQHKKTRKNYLFENKKIPSTTRWRRNKGNGRSSQTLEPSTSHELDEAILEDAAAADSFDNSIEENDDSQFLYIPEDIASDDEQEVYHATVGPQENQPAEQAQFGIWKLLDKPLLPNVPTTTAEAILLVMNFVLHYDLPWVAMEDLFKLLNIIFGTCILPQTKHLIGQLFGGMNSAINFHVYCPNCQMYLCKYIGKAKAMDMECSECKKIYNTHKLTSEGYYFVTLSVKDQMNSLLKNNAVCMALSNRLKQIATEENSNSIKDITDGRLYKRKRIELACSEDDLTLMFNTDGSPPFHSSKSSIWPIQFVVNELPPKLRWDNVLIGGLWFGSTHPNMTLFLNAYVEEMSTLAQETIEWTYDGCVHHSRIFNICASVDSPARALLQNSMQFNGRFGCTWCLHPGVAIDGTSQIRYTNMVQDVQDRDEKNVREDMQSSLQQNSPVHGLKGPSPLIILPGFDIAWGFSTDYLHSLLLGVTRQISELWLSDVDAPYYIGNPKNLQLINCRLGKIKIQHIITRRPRHLSLRKFWKGSEWRSWLLYYSIPCLSGILPCIFLHHWKLLVHASYLILKDDISLDDIHQIDILLTEFVFKTEILYNEAAMTSNVHQLSHYAKSTLLLGPAWSRSTFVFEHNNGCLKRLITAAKGLPMQIINRYNFWWQIKNYMSDQILNISARVRMAICDLNVYSLIQNCLTINEPENVIYMLGKVISNARISHVEWNLISNICNIDDASVQLFNRIVVTNNNVNSIYHSVLYNRAMKIDNTVVRSQDKYYRIRAFFAYKLTTSSILTSGVLAQELIVNNCEDRNLPPHIMMCEYPPENGNLKIFSVSKIERICFLIDLEDVKYVCNIPNIYERD